MDLVFKFIVLKINKTFILTLWFRLSDLKHSLISSAFEAGLGDGISILCSY